MKIKQFLNKLFGTEFERYWNGQMMRYWYLQGNVWECLKLILKAELTYKNIGMALTVWNPLRKIVIKKCNILNSK